MILLDTDHISLLQHPDSTEAQVLLGKIKTSSDCDIATTIITAEEQMRGWLQVIARYRNPRQQITYYDKLLEFIRFFGMWNILPLDDAAAEIFQGIQKVRISTFDLKIAAIALTNNALLLTRNTRDFERVPGLRFADWSRS
jgi:tRNA(fMet)-specific endonuclease VapC